MTVKVHELKCWPDWYDAIADRTKKFEIRRADRDFEADDYLWLREYNPALGGGEGMYTGRSALSRVTYLLDGDDAELGFLVPGFLIQGFVIMGIELMEEADVDFTEDYLKAHLANNEKDSA